MKLLAAVIAGMLGIIVYRSLKSGVVYWGRGREAFTVQRAEEPVSYWLLIVFELFSRRPHGDLRNRASGADAARVDR